MSAAIKVLTVRQPHATLIALGVKRIETRGQAFQSLVGQRIAIHAAAKRPADVWSTLQSDPTFPPALDYLYDRGICMDWFESADGDWQCHRWSGPLGAIVCTAVVTDSLPMVDDMLGRRPMQSCLEVVTPSYVREWYRHAEWGEYMHRSILGQIDYGDFRPGRFGLLLADVERVKPYAFKGGQGLSRSIDPALLRSAT